MFTNLAGQRLYVVAFNEAGRVTGDGANITCTIGKDGTRAALLDTNPVEIGTTGVYVFDLTQAESNAYELSPIAVSATSGVQVLPYPVIYTRTVESKTLLNAIEALETALQDIMGIGTVMVLPFIGYVPDRVQGKALKVFTNETITFTVPLVDGGGVPINLVGIDLWFGVWNAAKQLMVEATPTGTLNGFTVTVPPILVQGKNWQWVIRRTDSSELVYGTGPFQSRDVPRRIV